MMTHEDIQWDTLDIYDSPNLTYPKSETYSFPISDNTYDIVISGQVIEHVAKIWRWMPELARVTKPVGLVITVNPSSWPFHEAPIDCWRMYPDGMKALCEDAGLLIEQSFSDRLNYLSLLSPYQVAPQKTSPENWGMLFACWVCSVFQLRSPSTLLLLQGNLPNKVIDREHM
jgi:SAM-dependent methyltransferase